MGCRDAARLRCRVPFSELHISYTVGHPELMASAHHSPYTRRRVPFVILGVCMVDGGQSRTRRHLAPGRQHSHRRSTVRKAEARSYNIPVSVLALYLVSLGIPCLRQSSPIHCRGWGLSLRSRRRAFSNESTRPSPQLGRRGTCERVTIDENENLQRI